MDVKITPGSGWQLIDSGVAIAYGPELGRDAAIAAAKVAAARLQGLAPATEPETITLDPAEIARDVAARDQVFLAKGVVSNGLAVETRRSDIAKWQQGIESAQAQIAEWQQLIASATAEITVIEGDTKRIQGLLSKK